MKKVNKMFLKNSFTIFLVTISLIIAFSNHFDIDCDASDNTANESDGISEIFSSRFVTGLSNVANIFGHIVGKKPKIKTAADVDTSFTSCWMKNLKDDAELKDVLIPGSHDSGTYSMAPTTSLHLIGKAAQAQEMNVYNQAKVGARYFDFRARALNKAVVINHGIVNGCNVSVVLQSFLKFINENPSEIIILDMRYCSDTVVKKIMNFSEMKKIFEKSLTDSMCRDYPFVSMKQLRDLNVNFIIISDYNDEHFHSTWSLQSIYTERTRQSSSTDVMVNQELENLSHAHSYKMVNTTPVHTPTTKEFFLNKASPIDWEKKISNDRNKKLLSSDIFRKRANIVSLDALHYNEKFLKTLININKERSLMD